MSKEPYNYKGEVFHSPIVKVRWMGCKCVLPSVASGIEGGAGGGNGDCLKSHTTPRMRYCTAPL